jgi:hypothetical protein
LLIALPEAESVNLNLNQTQTHVYAPMFGWFSGSTRRMNSSVFSCCARASWCRPRAEYVLARLHIAAPRAERVILNINESTTKSRRTYVRMVLRQHAPLKLKRLLLHRKSILVPPNGRVRVGDITHCVA